MAFDDYETDDVAPEEEPDAFDGFDDFGDFDEVESEEEEHPGESNNRTFIIVAGVLAALIVLTIICMGIFAATQFIPKQQAARQTQESLKNTEQANLINQSLTETAGAPTATQLFPPTSTPSPSSEAQEATKTPVLANSATPTGESGTSATETVIALQTQLAAIQQTTVVPTELSTTGFADEVGAPGLIGLAIVLVLVIFLARRLRSG